MILLLSGHFWKIVSVFLMASQAGFFERNPQSEQMFQLYHRANWLIQSLVYVSHRSTDRLTGNKRKHREISVNCILNIVYFSKCDYQGNSSAEIFWQCLFWHLTPPGAGKKQFLYFTLECYVDLKMYLPG